MTPRSRVDYIRQMADSRVKVPGENPYGDDYGSMPYSEMVRLTNKHMYRPAEGERLKKTDNRITPIKMALLAKINGGPKTLNAYLYGDRKALNRQEAHRLSRILTMLDNGQLVMIDGGPVLLFKPKPMPKELVYRVSLQTDARGNLRPGITSMEPPKLHVMPPMFRDFKLPRTE